MFAEKIINWYHENGRDLPWRNTDDPYRIWLSEIILQQTRIEQGLDYYHHFIHEYPTVQHLAAATTEQVLKSWQGLGYYSRARNLHAAARHIAYDLDGIFPDTYKDILSLKGVGPYTAAAIASFAFRLPYPVIDGNVYRFISRLYGIHTPIGTPAAYREFETLLAKLIDKERPDLFNQAIMDFGSIYCKPIEPDCASCIFYRECVARNEGQVALLPAKPLHKQATTRYFYYLDTRWDLPRQTMLMHQRGPGDIWQGLYEPLLTERVLCGAVLLRQNVRHVLTHRVLYADFWLWEPTEKPSLPEGYFWVPESDLDRYGVPRLIEILFDAVHQHTASDARTQSPG